MTKRLKSTALEFKNSLGYINKRISCYVVCGEYFLGFLTTHKPIFCGYASTVRIECDASTIFATEAEKIKDNKIKMTEHKAYASQPSAYWVHRLVALILHVVSTGVFTNEF